MTEAEAPGRAPPAGTRWEDLLRLRAADVELWVRSEPPFEDPDAGDDPEFRDVLRALGAGHCSVCGKRGYLDGTGCCSAACDEKLEAAFVALGHIHGPDEPPTGPDGAIDWDACAGCVADAARFRP